MDQTTQAVVPNIDNEIQTLRAQSEDIISSAGQIQKIETADQYADAAQVALMLNTFKQGIMGFWKPLKDAAHKAHKALCDRENQMLAPIQTASASLDNKIRSYLEEQKRLHREAEMAAQAAARKQQEEEALKEAQYLAQQGDNAAAERVLEDAITAPVMATVPTTVPKIAGISQRTTWTFDLVDLRALVMAVSRGEVPLEALELNTVFVGQMVRAQKRKLAWPGIVVKEVAGIGKRNL